jgi:hypothetical protein
MTSRLKATIQTKKLTGTKSYLSLYYNMELVYVAPILLIKSLSVSLTRQWHIWLVKFDLFNFYNLLPVSSVQCLC